MFQWGAPVTGREQIGLGVFMNALEYYGKLKVERAIEDYRVYLTTNGNLHEQQGSLVVEGSAAQIGSLLVREDYLMMLTKAAHVVHNLTVMEADSGDAIPRRVERLQMARKELGIL
jgi:hypothetical protein